MSQAEMELWESFADRHRLQMDEAMHAAALSGLKYRLKHAGDESGTHVAAVCERALLARLNPPSWSGCPVAGLQAQPR